ncbi:DUF72 domain-containing protein [Sorangium sp. So ce1151]|uniref:DUF72 domain-containing protein n=1 Tax=Sorangium sp. So ce1151 TaxID=3133332 RepID=UPI003F6489C3
MARIYVGTAGWALPKESDGAFPGGGTHLERYARVLSTVEINSCFYRPHRASTYARWAASTPDDFRFALKLPRDISHADDLAEAAREHLREFVETSGELGAKLGCLLVQLPPSRAFEPAYVGAMAEVLGDKLSCPIAVEPRHPTWFTGEGDACLGARGLARAAADPPRGPGNLEAAASSRVAYFRLHGSPRIYYSAYGPERLAAWFERMRRSAREAEAVFCIFDNTAAGQATVDALATQEALSPPTRPSEAARSEETCARVKG